MREPSLRMGGLRAIARPPSFDEDVSVVKKLVYLACCMVPEHTHGCTHGIYVIKGVHVCDNITLGPGNFI